MTRRFLTEGCILDRTPTWIRRVLLSWQFWFTLFAIGLGWSFVLGYKALERTIHDESSSQAASYAACVDSIPELKKIATFVKGVNGVGAILVQNAKAVATATDPHDPQYAIRVANFSRLQRSVGDVAALRSLPVPTQAQCLEQSQHLPPTPSGSGTTTSTSAPTKGKGG